MRTPKWVVLLCVLSLVSLSLKPLQAYGISPFSGLEVANSQNPPGAKVFATKENSLAPQSGLQTNDVITSIEGHVVSSLDDFVRISKALKDKESVSLSINRGGEIVEVSLSKEPVGVAQPETKESAVPTAKETETKAPTPTTVAEGERIEDYFPMQEGARWEYRLKGTTVQKGLFGTRNEEASDTLTVECSIGVKFEGQEAILFLWNSSSAQLKKYFQVKEGALLFLGYEWLSSGTRTALRIYEPPLVSLRQPIMPNSTWKLSSFGKNLERKRTSIKGDIIIEGKENIEVPAGRFEAIKLISRINPEEVTEWYAKGVGLVKRIETFEGKQPAKYELLSYSIPTQLVARRPEPSGAIFEEKARAEAEAKAKVEAEARTKEEAEARAKEDAEDKAMAEAKVQAETPLKEVEAETMTVQKGFENPVVPNATGITYRHGQYPSEGNNTHPGIDITAECGSPIYAFADGEVVDFIDTEKDKNFNSLGYMAIIKHDEPIKGKDTYSIYLHMQGPPAVKKDQKVKAGDELGKVGDTGNAKGCHVHFELRHFPDRFLNDKGWNYPLNIYGKGDQRNEKRFLDNWEDPEVYFKKTPDIKKERPKEILGTKKPEYYGLYAFDKGKFFLLERGEDKNVKGNFSPNVTFVVFAPYAVSGDTSGDIGKTFVVGVPFIRKIIRVRPDYSSYLNPSHETTEEEYEKWDDGWGGLHRGFTLDIRSKVAVRFKMRPFNNKPDMVEIVPDQPLSPGVYAISNEERLGGITIDSGPFAVEWDNFKKMDSCVDLYDIVVREPATLTPPEQQIIVSPCGTVPEKVQNLLQKGYRR